MRSFLSYSYGRHQFPFPASKFRNLLAIGLVFIDNGNSIVSGANFWCPQEMEGCQVVVRKKFEVKISRKWKDAKGPLLCHAISGWWRRYLFSMSENFTQQHEDKRAKIRFLEMKKRQEAFSNQCLEFFSSHNALQCSEELLFQISGFNPSIC